MSDTAINMLNKSETYLLETALARLLNTLKGKVALSSYHCDIMDDLYGHWEYIEAPIKNCHSVKTPRREVLWVNYNIGKETQCRNHSKFSTQLFSEHPAI